MLTNFVKSQLESIGIANMRFQQDGATQRTLQSIY